MLTAFTILAVILGPSVWVVTSCLMLWRERRQEVLFDGAPNPKPYDDRENHQLLDIEGGQIACGLAIPVAAAVLGIIAFALEGIPPVELVVAMATVACTLWWLRLRRQGVRHAEVYAITVWLLTRFAWSAVILMDANEGSAFLLCPAEEVRGTECGIVNQLGGTTYLIATGSVAFLASLTALILTRCPRLPFNPAIPLVLAWPYIGLFWFTAPLGFAHAAFTLAVVGYAISREMRRIESDGAFGMSRSAESTTADSTANRVFGMVLSRGSAPQVVSTYFFVVLGLVALIFGVLGSAANPPEFGLVEFVTVQAMSVGAGALVALLVLVRKGKAARYGAMLLGLIWMLLMVATYDAPNLTRIAPPWTWQQYISTTIAAGIVVATMWRVFGPGSIRASPHQPRR